MYSMTIDGYGFEGAEAPAPHKQWASECSYLATNDFRVAAIGHWIALAAVDSQRWRVIRTHMGSSDIVVTELQGEKALDEYCASCKAGVSIFAFTASQCPHAPWL
eukprot:COSAG02_NODE_339_length_24201_cov_45.538462_20_plen_105_part_00